ncbi:MAG: cation transporter [Lachnospiraceae bacterium]|nr:cation transporter [Lachnospiraceae bacterium]MBQ5473983.1 cation transporter [Lachnospiraceae bacterium]
MTANDTLTSDNTLTDIAQIANSRNKKIIQTSIIGIVTNVILASFKAIIGLLTHSIAITMDAVNNISDSASSIITIVGTKLASKDPDREHPFGHGRIEYLSAMIISIIVLYAGLTSFTESVKKIVNPVKPDYTVYSLIIVGVGVFVKIILGKYVKSVGVKVNSDSLVNSGEDALLDSIISSATLAAALIYIFGNISLESWLAAIISLIIIKSGVDMLKDTISKILGERADRDLSISIKETVKSFPDVSGAYDLVLNNYGPNSYNGSIHIEIPDTYTAFQIDELVREITVLVYKKHNVLLTAIGIYSVNTKDEYIIKAREHIYSLAMSIPYVLQAHGFYLSTEKKTIRFDVVVSFDSPDRRDTYNKVYNSIKKEYPDYLLEIALDIDFSDIS